MKNTLIIIFIVFGAYESFAQNNNEWKFQVGFNKFILTNKNEITTLSPTDFTTIVDVTYESSSITLGTNYGIQRAFNVSKNKQWRIITGLQYQDFSYMVNAFSETADSRFLYVFSNKVSQWDIPLLASFIKSRGKFSFGGDAGIFQTVFVSSNYKSSIDQLPIRNPEILGESQVESKGFVNHPLDKVSLYMAPFARIDLTNWLIYEIQPFIRYQNGGAAFGIHNSRNNPAFGQWGLNTGLVIKF
ncbi:MAG: hypothetical protein ACXIUD_06670 [Mongoliitalea sp.]